MRRFLPGVTAAISFIVLLWAAMPAMPDGPISRNWVKYPAILRINQQPERLFVVGDVHGDFDRLEALLVRAGLIDMNRTPGSVYWTGGNAVLVLTGDLIDKGPHPVAVIRLLAAIRETAPRAGGQVVVTMGNHEAEFLAGEGKPGKGASKSGKTANADNFADDLQRNGIDRGTVLECNGDLGQFLCSLPFAAKIGDWFFSHAGNTDGHSLAQLSQALEQGVTKDGFLTKELSDPDSLVEARLGEGKVWFHPAEKGSDARQTEHGILAADAAALGVSHMVQGHQPGEVKFDDGVVRHKGEMFQRWGLLFLIDTGMSRDIDDSKGTLLSISRNGTAVAICPDGTETKLWDETTRQAAAHAGLCTR